MLPVRQGRSTDSRQQSWQPNAKQSLETLHRVPRCGELDQIRIRIHALASAKRREQIGYDGLEHHRWESPGHSAEQPHIGMRTTNLRLRQTYSSSRGVRARRLYPLALSIDQLATRQARRNGHAPYGLARRHPGKMFNEAGTFARDRLASLSTLHRIGAHHGHDNPEQGATRRRQRWEEP
jgi:hypothetical protein